MKVKEAAEKYGLSEMFVREMCKRGIFGTTYGTGTKRKAVMVSDRMIAEWMGDYERVKKPDAERR